MKIFKHSLIILTAFIILIAVFSSCKKSTESKLIGKWKWVNVYDTKDTLVVEDWEFKSNGDLIIKHRDPGLGVDSIETWNSKFYMESYRKFTISGMENEHLPQYNATWEIVKLKKDILMIVNDKAQGLYFREFYKM